MTDTEEKAVALHEYQHAIQEGQIKRAEDIAAKRIRFREGPDGYIEEYRTNNALLPMLPGEVPQLEGSTVDWFGEN